MPIDLQNIDGSKELQDLYRTLSELESVAKSFVSDAQNETNAIKRAKDLNERLEKSFNKLREFEECHPPRVWNPVTETCE